MAGRHLRRSRGAAGPLSPEMLRIPVQDGLVAGALQGGCAAGTIHSMFGVLLRECGQDARAPGISFASFAHFAVHSKAAPPQKSDLPMFIRVISVTRGFPEMIYPMVRFMSPTFRVLPGEPTGARGLSDEPR